MEILTLDALTVSVADPHNFDADPDADPDPTFHLDADSDPDPNPSFQIKEQNLEKVLKQAQIPYILDCHLQTDADPDPAYQFDADPDPVLSLCWAWGVVQLSKVSPHMPAAIAGEVFRTLENSHYTTTRYRYGTVPLIEIISKI